MMSCKDQNGYFWRVLIYLNEKCNTVIRLSTSWFYVHLLKILDQGVSVSEISIILCHLIEWSIIRQNTARKAYMPPNSFSKYGRLWHVQDRPFRYVYIRQNSMFGLNSGHYFRVNLFLSQPLVWNWVWSHIL